MTRASETLERVAVALFEQMPASNALFCAKCKGNEIDNFFALGAPVATPSVSQKLWKQIDFLLTTHKAIAAGSRGERERRHFQLQTIRPYYGMKFLAHTSPIYAAIGRSHVSCRRVFFACSQRKHATIVSERTVGATRYLLF
jgi:hypothetical protein